MGMHTLPWQLHDSIAGSRLHSNETLVCVSTAGFLRQHLPTPQDAVYVRHIQNVYSEFAHRIHSPVGWQPLITACAFLLSAVPWKG